MYSLATFYRSTKWVKLMDVLRLERVNENGDLICEHCGKPIVKKYDAIGHHIKELTESNVNDFSISLNPDNVMIVHHNCHNEIHQRFGYDSTRHVYLVYGSPCSGKATFVKDNAHKDDLILDIDSIYQCISTNDRYIKPKRLATNVYMIRDCIIDMVKTRHGRFRNAYIIGGYPIYQDRERLANELNAELIHIDTSKEECLLRAKENRPKGYDKFILEWFDLYERTLPPTPSSE